MRTETSARSSAARVFGRAATRTAAFVALCVLSAAASAQSCTPATPRNDPGTGFTPFGANEQVLIRGGNKGRAWELAVGTDTGSGQKVLDNLDWISGKVYRWKIVNSGTGSEVLEIRDSRNRVRRLTYPSDMDAGNALELRVSTNPSVGPKITIAASLKRLNGHAVSGSLSLSGTRKRSEQALYYYFPQMAQGFTAEGTVSLTYPRKLPSGSRVRFTVRAGTIPCSSPSNPPTVSISAPAANSVFTAPATITVTADAQDSGTVAQVAFYANGNPIGTATSSPYTIQWASVPAGSYSLTAVATDNDGLQTTSAKVPVTVSAGQALYFIHVDHLNTPRLIADQTQKTVWRWDQEEPFGNNLANEDPDGDSVAFRFPQRFPGQYYDAETLLHYNYFRDYDPSLGRYGESDPIGLRGGLNTFAYVTLRPLNLTDPKGLDIWLCNRQVNLVLRVGNHAYFWNDKNDQCCGRNTGDDPLLSCREKGPGGDACVRILGTAGSEDNIMRCCQRSANEDPWFPYYNDCHDSADRCLSPYGFRNPGAPGGRMGSCTSCWLSDSAPPPVDDTAP